MKKKKEKVDLGNVRFMDTSSLMNPHIEKRGPEIVGAFLDKAEIKKVASLMYNRFDYVYGVVPHFSHDDRVQQMKINEVMQVLDSLSLCGFKVVPMGDEDDRYPKAKTVSSSQERI